MNAVLDRSGVLVLRAWTHGDDLIARVRATSGDDEIADAAVGVGVEAIIELIRDWLVELGANGTVTEARR